MSARSGAGKRRGLARAMGLPESESICMSGNRRVKPARVDPPKLNLQPMSDLDLMIANGWGDTPQVDLPPDWRTRTQ